MRYALLVFLLALLTYSWLPAQTPLVSQLTGHSQEKPEVPSVNFPQKQGILQESYGKPYQGKIFGEVSIPSPYGKRLRPLVEEWGWVRWDPCKPIPIWISHEKSPYTDAYVEPLMDGLLTEMAELTGLQFAYKGDIPYKKALGFEARPGISIVFEANTTDLQSSDDEDPSAAVGLGRYKPKADPRLVATEIAQGQIRVETLREDIIAPVLSHEFAHALGVGHSAHRADLMAPKLRVRAWSDADLYGLRYVVGAAAGCIPKQ